MQACMNMLMRTNKAGMHPCMNMRMRIKQQQLLLLLLRNRKINDHELACMHEAAAASLPNKGN
jgi:hypothetical protein